jgi:hypothetical protein
MDQSAFENADPVIDEISELVDQSLTSDHLAELRKALVKLSEVLGSRYSVGLNVTLDVFEQAMRTVDNRTTVEQSKWGHQDPPGQRFNENRNLKSSGNLGHSHAALCD